MKKHEWMFALIITLSIVLGAASHQRDVERAQILSRDISILNGHIQRLTTEYESLKEEVKAAGEARAEMEQEIRQLLDGKLDIPSRGGDRPRKMTVRATAYDLSVESCGKLPGHPEYGITASGKPVREWYTVAAGPELKFGTQVYIPEFAGKPNKGWFTVEDRGGLIKNGCIDIFMKDGGECRRFGVKRIDVYVLGVEK